MPDENFVADGHERLTKSSEFRAARAEVIAAVRARYAEQLAGAGILLRLAIHLRMRREIAQELDKLAPPAALYFRT
ncbi:MAG TPA: hypothetical protein VF414_02075 [Thermoanaerobaculia bacterium]